MFLQNIAKVIEESPETEAGADNLHYGREMVDRACKLFRDGKHEELGALTNEIRDEISKTIILNDATWEGLRCRICLAQPQFLRASAYARTVKRN